MALKLNFKGRDKFHTDEIPTKVNGLVNKLLGENNEYHGKFSNYSISPLRGGTFDSGYFTFDGYAYFTISMPDEMIDKIINSIVHNHENLRIGNLKYHDVELLDFNVHSDYDIIRTIGPIRLQTKDKFVTFKDNNFIELLRDRSVKKLIYNGIDEKDANSITFELFHPENARTIYYVSPNNKGKTIASHVMLIVRGNKNARKKLYELGLGSSTGFCFGSVEIYNRSFN